MAGGEPMEIGVLGPFEVSVGDRRVEFGSAKERALLALLALEAGSVVSTDRLVDAIWGEEPPESVPVSLRVLVSRVRKALGDEAGALATRSPGYVLAIDPERVDGIRFERLAARGREELAAGDALAAAATLRDALALWRGSPLAGLPLMSAHGEVSRLEEARIAALEDRIDADLGCGRQVVVAGELESVIAQHPLRERLWRARMLALYRCGRQADALAAYQQLRDTLVDELGVDPSRDVVELQRKILAQDPSLDFVAARASIMPSGVVTFLLTDIEGSTEMWERAPKEMGAALARHDEIVSDVVRAAGGSIVKTKGEGDSTLSVFQRATDAAGAALSLRDRLLSEPWPEDIAIRIRAAVHTGEAQERDGDYFGQTVNRGARLRGLATGGQILLSQATAELIRDHLPHVTPLDDLGMRELKGLGRAEHVFELGRSERRAPEPEPLASSKALPTQLAAAAEGLFVGRDVLVERLEHAWKDVVAGNRRVLFLAGEPGIGKTRLASEFARAAFGDGAVVLYGHSDEEALTPYQPFVEALDHYVSTHDIALLREHLGTTGGELARLVPEIARKLPDLPPPLAGDAEGERYRLFEATTDLLASLTADSPVLLLLDDLHWADKPTLLLLRHILRSQAPTRLLVLGAYRETDLARSHPLADVLADLHRERAYERLQVKGLDEPAVGSLVGAWRGGEVPEDFTRALWSETEGNPFFVGQVLRHLEAVPDDPRALEEMRIPESIREVVGRRMARLGEDANEGLSAASAIGQEFGLDVLERVVDLEGDRLLRAVEEATSAGIVREAPERTGRYLFAHALVRQTLYEELSALRRARLHRRIGEAIEVVHARDLEPVLAELARHFLVAATAGDGEKAIEYSARAGERAMSVLAFEEAAIHFQNVIQALEQSRPDDRLELCRVLLKLGEAQTGSGEAGFKKTLIRAAELARSLGAAEEFAKAALLYSGLIVAMRTQLDPESFELIEEAERMLPKVDSPLRAGILSRLSVGLFWNNQQERAKDVGREALEIAKRIGWPGIIAETQVIAVQFLEPPEELKAHTRDLSRMVGAEAVPEVRLAVLGFDIQERVQAGNRAEREVEEYNQLASRLRHPQFLRMGIVYRAMLALLRGAFEEGERLALEAREMGERYELANEGPGLFFSGQMAYTWIVQGRFDELRLWAAVGVEKTPHDASRGVVAWVKALTGAKKDARADFEALAAHGFENLSRDALFLMTLAPLSEVCALLDDGQRAARLYELLLPFAGQNLVLPGGMICWGPNDYFLGILAATSGSAQTAIAHLETSLAMCQRLEARPFSARTQVELARALLQRDAPGDVERARELASAALATSLEIGMPPIAEKARALLRPPIPTRIRIKSSAPFVGREAQLEELRAQWKAEGDNVTRAVFIAGEPGIGKTRLAAEFVAEAHREGAVILYGRSDEETAVPYQPFVEALRTFFAGSSEELLRPVLGASAGELTRLMPELPRTIPDLPSPIEGDPDGERYRLFEAVGDLISVIARAAPVVLLIDDLHWADKPTLLLLKHLLRRDDPSRFLLVGTYRETELGRTHPLSETLGDLRREQQFERIILRGLSEPDVGTLLGSSTVSDAAPELTHAVFQETEGNPFFVGEVIRHLQELGTGIDLNTIGIPEGIKEVIGSRLGRLSPECNELLSVASAIGSEFSLRVLERALDMGADEAIHAIEQAVIAGILIEGSIPGRYGFSHALIRQTLYEELTGARRLHLHKHIGEAIEEVYADNLETRLPELAHHFVQAAGTGDVGKAVDYATRAGKRAMKLLAYEEAVADFERALQVIDLGVDDADETRCRLHLWLGESLLQAGEIERANEMLLRAADLARATGRWEDLARAAVLLGGRLVMYAPVQQENQAGVIRLLEEAAERLPQGDSSLRARVLARLAVSLFWTSRERMMSMSEEAVAMARRIGDPSTIAYGLNARRYATWGPDIEVRLELADEILRFAVEGSDREREFEAHHWRFIDLLELGDARGAERELAMMASLAEELRTPAHAWYMVLFRGVWAMLRGDFDKLQRLTKEALELGERLRQPDATSYFASQMSLFWWMNGTVATMSSVLEEAVALVPDLLTAKLGSAAFLFEAGRPEQARELFDEASRGLDAAPRDLLWTQTMIWAAEGATMLHDTERAAEIYELLSPYQDQVAVSGPPALTVYWPISYFLGRLSMMLGRVEEAIRHLQTARDITLRMEAPALQAGVEFELARAFMARAASSDIDRAHQLLRNALTIAERVGMAPLIQKVRALQRPALSTVLASGDGSAFVGRHPQLERLGTVWSDTKGGTRSAVLISGEPGIGKTRLAAEVARRAYDEGAVVLYGRCDEEPSVPYQPFVEVLQTYISNCPTEVLRDHVQQHGGDLGRVVPELRRRLPDAPELQSSDSDVERYRTFEAVRGLLASISMRDPIVLVLDDLHWAAKPTLLLLRHLLRSSERMRLLVIGTYRETDLDRSHPLAEMLNDFRRESSAERIALSGLDEPAVFEYLQAAAGEDLNEIPTARSFARLLHAETEGNPFFIGEVLQSLADAGVASRVNGRWTTNVTRPEDLGLPQGVREAVARRLSRLSVPANEMLAAAAVAGSTFSIDVLERVLEVPLDAVLSALDECLRAGVIAEAESPGDFRFEHALIRQTLTAELTSVRRIRLHAQIAQAIEALYASAIDAHATELAHHFFESAPGGHGIEAARYCTLAGDQAMAHVAYEEAAEHYRHALEALALITAEQDQRADLLLKLGEAEVRKGDVDEGKRVFLEAANVARASGSPERLARAALGYGFGWGFGLVPREPDEALTALIDEALTLNKDDSPIRVGLLARLTDELSRPADADRLDEVTRQAVEIAERLGDPSSQLVALNARQWALLGPDGTEERLQAADRMLMIAERVADNDMMMRSRWMRLRTLVELGRIQEAEEEFSILEREADRLRQPRYRWNLVAYRAMRAIQAGRFDESEALADDALDLGSKAFDEWFATYVVGGLRLTILRGRGRLDEGIDVVDRYLTENQLIATQVGLGALLAEQGRFDDARSIFSSFASDDFSQIPRDGYWLTTMSSMSIICARLNDSEKAFTLYRMLEPYQDRIDVFGGPVIFTYDPVATHLGILATTAGQWAEAERHFQRAFELEDLMGCQAFVSRTHGEFARMLVARDEPGDLDRAHRLIADHRAVAEELGLGRWKRTARELLYPRFPQALTLQGETSFVGRQPQLERLRALWTDATHGERRVALISGEPGIGKTRLAAEFARQTFNEKAIVLYGRCDEDPSVPYQPFVEALRAYVSCCPVEILQEHVRRHEGDLIRVVPELRRRIPDLPEPASSDPEVERYRSFEAVVGLLAAASTRDPIVLVLDDLHWAAKPTLLLLRHLLRSDADMRLLLIGTYRETDLDRSHPLAEMLNDFRREGSAERIALTGLDEPAVFDFLQAAAGHDLDEIPTARDFSRLLHAETEGNPFFIREILQNLAETGVAYQVDGRWTADLPSPEEIGLPQGVREAVARRLSRLSDAANKALAVAAVVGMSFSVDVIERVSEAGGGAILDALDEARQAGLIVEAEAPGEYRFAHALVRQTLAAEVSSIRRLRLHASIARAMEEVFARSVDAHLPELAHHFFEAAHGGNPAKAAEYCRRAGEQASERAAYDDAAEHYRRAREALALTDAGDAVRAELLLALGGAEARKGDTDQSKRTCADAAELARRIGSAELLARAALGYGWGGGIGLVPVPPDKELTALIEEALASMGPDDTALRVRLLARLAGELGDPADADRLRSVSSEAVEVAERLGDDAIRLIALHARTWALAGPKGAEERLVSAERMIKIAEATGDSDIVIRARHLRARTLIELGSVSDGWRELDAIAHLADELRQPVYQWLALANRSGRAIAEGRFEEGERLAEESWQVGQKAYDERVAGLARGVLLFQATFWRGRFDEAVDLMIGVVEAMPNWWSGRAALASLLAWAGRLDEAREAWETVAANDFTEIAYDSFWYGTVGSLVPACTRLRDVRRAERLYEIMSTYADRGYVAGGPLFLYSGMLSQSVGMLATTLERWDDAQRFYEHAMVAHPPGGGTADQVAGKLCFAEMLLARRAPGDVERAIGLLSEAIEWGDAVGAFGWSEKCRQLLEVARSA